jgi:glutamate carboxypeptidase
MPLSIASFQDHHQQIVDDLRHMIDLESPTTEKPLVDALGAWVAGRAEAAGLRVERFPQTDAGDHWLASLGDGPGGILLLHHLDTVYPAGTLAAHPWRIEGARLFAPGALDMKGGIAVSLAAVDGLRRARLEPRTPVRLLFTSDEETGSRTSRGLIEDLARRHDLVLCLEPAMPDGALKTQRKGTGLFFVEALGRSAHAGNDPQAGINAILEMAHQVPQIHALAAPAFGTTVSVGVIEGGTRSNVIPDRCRVRVDVRVVEAEERARIEAGFTGLRPVVAGARIEWRGGWNRPPMPRTQAIGSAFDWARTVAAGLGLDLREGAAGGGSDANFVAALGKPVLDGLGPLGDGAHSPQEHVLIESLAERAALVAALLTAES